MEQEQVQSSGIIVSEGMTDALRATKPWTMFVAILGFVSLGFMVLGGLIMVAANQFIPQQEHPYMMTAMGLAYILMALIYLFPALYLFKYSSAIGRFLDLKQASEMEAALGFQKSFWKFVGILCLIMLILAVLGIIAAFVIGFIAATR